MNEGLKQAAAQKAEGLAALAGKLDSYFAHERKDLDAFWGAPAKRREVSALTKCLAVRVGPTRLAIKMTNVIEVQASLRITLIPLSPSWLRGVANLRGNVISAIDLRRFLSLPEVDSEERVVVVRAGAEPIETALLVNQVEGIRALALHKPLGDAKDKAYGLERYAEGLFEDRNGLLVLLDLGRMLSSREFRRFDGA